MKDRTRRTQEVLDSLSAKDPIFGKLISHMSPITFTSESALTDNIGQNCYSLVERGIIPEAMLADSSLTEYLAGLLLDKQSQLDAVSVDPEPIDYSLAQDRIQQYVRQLKAAAVPNFDIVYSGIESFPSDATDRYAFAIALVSVAHSLDRAVLPLWKELAYL